MTAMTATSASDQLIRRALLANGVFCMASGLGMAALSGPLSDWIGAPRLVLVLIGVGLVPWGAMLFAFSRRAEVRRADAWSAIAGDEAWVIGTLILVLGFPTALSSAGNALAVVVALVVAAFAVVQYLGLRRTM